MEGWFLNVFYALGNYWGSGYEIIELTYWQAINV